MKKSSIRSVAVWQRLWQFHKLFVSEAPHLSQVAAFTLVAAYVVVALTAYTSTLQSGSLAIKIGICGDTPCVSSVSPGGLGWHYGVRPGMVVLSVNGRRLTALNADFAAGVPVTEAVLLTSTGEHLHATVTLEPISQGPVRFSIWIVGGTFALLGAVLVLRRPDFHAAKMFFLFAGATAIALGVAPSSGGPAPPWARIVQGLALIGIGASVVPFASTLAADPPWPRPRYLAPTFVGITAILLTSYVVSLFVKPSLYSLVRPATLLYVATSILAGIGIVAFKGSRWQSPLGRQQARLVLWGMAAGTLPFVTLTLVPEALGYPSLAPIHITVLAVGIIPAAFAYAILQYQLLGIRRLVHRGMVYGTAAFVLLVVIAVFLTLVPLRRAELRGVDAAFVSGTLVVAILIFLLLRRGARWMVDRFIYRDVFSYSTVLDTLRRELPVPKHASEVADFTAQYLIRLLRVESVLVFLGHSPWQSSMKVAAGTRAQEVIRLVQPQVQSLLEGSETREMIEMRWQSDSLLVAPLYSAGEYLGYLLLGPKAGGEIFVDEEKRLVAITVAMLALAIAKSELSEELREVNRKLVKAEESERARIAADLHDGPLQTAILLVGSASTKDDSQATLARQLVSELREIGARLRPAILDDLGLVAALEWLLHMVSEQFGMRTRLSLKNVAEEERFAPQIELALFRAAQEAVNNAGKHAKGTWLEVSLSKERSALVLKVTDDGVGFLPQTGRMSGSGLAGMRERIAQVDGSLEVRSAPGSGTTVLASIPLKDDRQAW